MKTVAIVSGGMDSVTLAHFYADLGGPGDELRLLSVDYGQRHKKEIVYARRCAERLGAVHEVADLSGINALLSGSALTSPEVEVPEGHYADPTMRLTVVPNRNAIMLSVAVGYAVSVGADRVATAVHAGDHPVYPDCRPEFVDAFSLAARLGTQGFSSPGFSVVAPFVELTKTDIARIGDHLGVPFEETWSCYRGEEVHCGRCGTCCERIEALVEAGVEDPTPYADREFWRSVTG